MLTLSGNTPLVRISYRLDGREGAVWAKLESYNPSGSIKDRVAEYMLEQAILRGELAPGQPIVEVTSGNTGIAFAAVGARTGHPVHLFMPDWASEERKKLMRLYGATLHEVSREDGGFLASFRMAEALAGELGAYQPRQFDNRDNVLAHRLTTGAELVRELPGITDFCSGVGTGGTLTGTAQALRAAGPVRITAVEPDACALLSGGTSLRPHRIEGISDELIPSILDRRLIDRVQVLSDLDAVWMAARLSRELGLGVGISSGANFLGAAESDGPGRVSATVFPDDSKKYLSTSLSDPLPPSADSVAARIELLGVDKR